MADPTDPAAASSTITDPASLTGDPASITGDPTSISIPGSTIVTLASTTITIASSSISSLTPAQSSQAAQLSGGENVTDYLGSVGSCLMPGAMPIVIQNSTQWEKTGCLPGFYCELSKLRPKRTELTVAPFLQVPTTQPILCRSTALPSLSAR